MPNQLVQNETDICMEVTHSRKTRTPKTEFKMVVNKWLIGAMIVTSLLGGVSAPSYADTSSNINSTVTVTQNYQKQNYSEEIRVVLEGKVSQIEKLKLEGTLSRRLFSESALLLQQLTDAVLESGETPSQAILNLVNRAEQTTVGLSGVGVEDLKLSAQNARQAFGMGAFVAQEVTKPTITASTETTAPKPAATAVKLSDIGSHWGKSYIERLVSLGGIKGYSDGSFKPDKNITRAEFLSIAMNSTSKDVSKYPKTSAHWASQVLEAAYDMGIVTTKDIANTSESLDKSITRQEMAMILVRVNENIQKESMAGTSGVSTVMADNNKIPEYYKSFVEQAYMKGFITGVDTKGTFAGDKLGTRAQAATMVVRLLDKNIRSVPKIDATKVIAPTRAAMTFYEGKASSILPRAGDTWVTKSGQKIVLKSIFWNGYEVIAPMQGIAVHTVMNYPDGSFVEQGARGIMWQDSIRYMAQKYIIDPATGEGHFENDWGLMAAYYVDRAETKYGMSAKDGQRFEECKYVYFDASFGWTWDGPSAAWLE